MNDRRPELAFILSRDDRGEFRLWACRGEGKGCVRNQYRKQKAPCEDCYGPCDERMTIGELQERLTKGDA